MFRVCGLLLASLFLLNSCSNEQKAASDNTTNKPTTQAKISPLSTLDSVATTELMNMVHHYYGLKDALVATDGAKADESASRLMSAAEIFLAEHASGGVNTEQRPLVEAIMKQSDSITHSKPDDIEAKRRHFAALSDAMYKVVSSVKLENAGIYHQYCPMAFDFAGAYWLSSASEIRNPYFGNKMLECGEVRDSLK